MDIAAWLRDLGLAQYEPMFRENDVDAQVLPRLTAEDLTSIGGGCAVRCWRAVEAMTGATAGDRPEPLSLNKA